MRSPIRILPEHVVARIAAGEVIERPASVVKELVENALDAQARNVHVEVYDAGFGLIRVSDDGIGIPAEELWLACQRHATSKLPEDDLLHIRTLGFRGEALPSIAAVSELELVSATGADGVGARVVVRHGRCVLQEPAPRLRGTTATVRHLFDRVPARRAALRNPRTETAQIVQTVRRLALAAPHVAFSLSVDRRAVLRTSGSGDLETALVEVYGAGIAGRLVRLEPVEVGRARVEGFVSAVEVTRPHRADLHFITNGRWAQPRGLVRALEAAYRWILPRGRHPILAVTIETAPELVDVNLHPAKLEVRLVEEAAIATGLSERVRSALGRRPKTLVLLGPPPSPSPADRVEERPEGWEVDRIVTPNLPPLRLVDQVQDRLLLLEGPDGLYLVDQHRAHERVLYEHLRSAHAASAPPSVELPDPLVIDLRPSQVDRFARRLGEFESLGFRLEVFGARAFLVRAAPPLPGVLEVGEAEEVARVLVDLAEEEPEEMEGWRERLLVELACRTAVRRGRRLERQAMRELVEALGRVSAPAVCPHGSPVILQVTEEILGRQFRWR
ncbi:MAG: DNA mismatch repair endonuclease MutL [Armatimonadota bacterium]|nr:DNA mismatch repair endonuclease MutL [Armatimonadota bacterium]MDR7444751.1 DNA mismatch repair endonuclease MutL [Armatimonadota bacterium]MDR7569247.1 DNA mismatch repair endonuclease MutL [Armatimonadota bacterium]MDR7613365.1 DNA mismatch repair endonuclease MutL [Armatimonadota bacterium]